MRAVGFIQAATEGNSSGGMIYQCAAPSFAQQWLPCVTLRYPSNPPAPRLAPVLPPRFYLTDRLTSRQPKKPWEPLCTVCHRWIIGFRCTCSGVSAASNMAYQFTVLCWLQCSCVLYEVLVYRCLGLEKQACHPSKLCHFFPPNADLISPSAWFRRRSYKTWKVS